jgi:putative addiction module component
MSAYTSKVLKEALNLPPEAHAVLAGTLFESLEEILYPNAGKAWEDEIAKRPKEVDASPAQLIPWSVARRKTLNN